MQIYVQGSGAASIFSGDTFTPVEGATRRGSQVEVGWGLVLYEDDVGLPGLQVDKFETNHPNESLTFNADNGTAYEINNLTAGEWYLDTFKRPWYDAFAYDWCRIVGDIQYSGTGGGQIRLQFSKTPLVSGSWQPVASGATEWDYCHLPLFSHGSVRGDWYPMHQDASSDNSWRLMAFEHPDLEDTSLKPTLGYVGVEFTKRPPVQVTRWYFRDTLPVYDIDVDTVPATEQIFSNGVLLNGPAPYAQRKPKYAPMWDEGNRSLGLYWDEPNPVLVYSLLREKGDGTNQITLSHRAVVGAGNPSDRSGPLGRFVSPPIRRGILKAGIGHIGFSATCEHGSASGYLAAILRLYRPGQGFIWNWKTLPPDVDYTWFRYIPRDRQVRIMWSNVKLLDYDRFVVDIYTTAVYNAGVFIIDIYNRWKFNGVYEDFTSQGFTPITPQGVGPWISLPYDIVTLQDYA